MTRADELDDEETGVVGGPIEPFRLVGVTCASVLRARFRTKLTGTILITALI